MSGDRLFLSSDSDDDVDDDCDNGNSIVVEIIYKEKTIFMLFWELCTLDRKQHLQ